MSSRGIMLVGGSFATAMAAIVMLAMWGTRWTVPQARETTAGYRLVGTWNGAEAPGGRLVRPIGIAVAPYGDVYVTDALLRVVQFGLHGEVRREWGREGSGRGEFKNPVGIAVGPDGTVYVSDYEQDRIQTFGPTGEFRMAFGSSGSGPGQFRAPAGLAVDRAGIVYVADFYNHRVQTFGKAGLFQRVIGRPGRLGRGALHYPTGVAITRDGEVLVADAYNYQLQWFDRQGDAVHRVGYHLFWIWPRPVSSTAGFAVPTGAAVGPGNVVHVADSSNHRVVMLSPGGAYMAAWRIPDPARDLLLWQRNGPSGRMRKGSDHEKRYSRSVNVILSPRRLSVPRPGSSCVEHSRPSAVQSGIIGQSWVRRIVVTPVVSVRVSPECAPSNTACNGSPPPKTHLQDAAAPSGPRVTAVADGS